MSHSLLQLLNVKWQSARNSLRGSAFRLGLRIFVIVLIGLAFWAFIFGTTYWFTNQAKGVEVFGDVLVEKFVALAFLVVFTVLFFSNLVSSFSVYFLADDLELLVPRPLPPYSFYSARFIELLLQSSWMVAIYGLPVFVAAGMAYKVGWDYYLILVVVLLPLPVIATALATIISLLLTNILPARRTRELLVLMLVMLFVVIFIIFRTAEPERFLNPDERASLIEVMSFFDPPSLGLLPSEWVHRALWPSLHSAPGETLVYTFGLYATAAALFIIGGWLFRWLHASGYSKTCEGRHEGAAPERILRTLLAYKYRPEDHGKAGLQALSRRKRHLSYLREIWRKDVRTFIRDTGQWSQMILLVALIIIYLLNFKYVRTIGEGGIIGPVGLFFANLSLASFVITALCARFVFPMVSLEGRSFWLIRSAPIRTVDFLRSKWLFSAGLLWVFGQFLLLTSNLMIGSSGLMMTLALLFQTPAIIGVVGLALGVGALFPRLNVDNAAKIATGFGGFFFMGLGVSLSLGLILASSLPILFVVRAVEGSASYWMTSPSRVALAISLALVSMILPIVIGETAIRLGARNIEKLKP